MQNNIIIGLLVGLVFATTYTGLQIHNDNDYSNGFRDGADFAEKLNSNGGVSLEICKENFGDVGNMTIADWMDGEFKGWCLRPETAKKIKKLLEEGKNKK